MDFSTRQHCGVLSLCMASILVVPLITFSAVPTFGTLGKPDAPIQGTFYDVMSTEPQVLNPITASDLYARWIHDLTTDGLMVINEETNELEPGLATGYETDPDGEWFIFHIREGAKWHDGRPVTAEDVKFSFDVVFDDRYAAVHRRPFYENFEKVTVLDKDSVRFDMKKKYFNNLRVIASGGYTPIVPKHIYGDPKKRVNKTVVGSGPYKLKKYNKGRSIVLERNKEWWGNKIDHLKGKFKAKRIQYRFVDDPNVRLEMAKKGEVDFIEMTAEQYVKKAVGPQWGKKVKKFEVKNDEPKSYRYVAWNFRDSRFRGKKTRQALAHLMNRKLMNEKFRYGKSFLATGPWYLQNPYADPKVKPIAFDPQKAKRLFRADGWADSNKDGVLDKRINGTRTKLQFSILFATKEMEKYLTVYKEDLRKAGVAVTLKLVDWNSLIKALDEQKFQAISLGWGGGSVDHDPKQIWHSSSAHRGGSNFISYSNTEVDKLIDQAREELDRDKRIKKLQKVYRLIADDAPYAFMFVDKFYHYGISDKIGQVKDTYRFDVGKSYWWVL